MRTVYTKRRPSETVYVPEYYVTYHEGCVMEFLSGHVGRCCPVCYPTMVLAEEGETDQLLPEAV